MSVRDVAVRDQGRFAKGWAAAIEQRGHTVRWLDVYQPDALDEIRSCDALFCAMNQDSPRDLRHLGSLLETIERAGCTVFPDHHSRWYFDDKVVQASLFRALDIPTPKTWVFFDRQSAEVFVETAQFPLVFKLAAGAGSQNVRLVANSREGMKWVRRMFSRGVIAYPLAPRLQRAIKQRRRLPASLAEWRRVLGSAWRLFTNSFAAENRERGYVLFQQLVPDNTCDFRVTVIGDRAFCYTRGVRDNDFRASGSGKNTYLQQDEIDTQLISLAFQIRGKLKASCIAMDFVRDHVAGTYRLLEISSSFIPDFVALCTGYFTPDLAWVPGSFSPEECMVADVLGPRLGEAGRR